MSATQASSRNLASRTLAYSSALLPSPWTRPADWLTLPTVLASDEKFVGLHAVYSDGSNFLALSASGDYTVDWGDGSAPENIASGVQANHTYDYSTYDVSNTTLCSRGYKQCIVTVTMQAGQHLTALNLHRSTGSSNAYVSGFLDIAIAGQYLYDLRIGVATQGSATQYIVMGDLERVNIVSSRVRNCSYLFYMCASLQDVSLSLSDADATPISVIFTDAGDLVTANGHGLLNGDMLVLLTSVTTTGMIVGNSYYVISATADTFQVSTTMGGAAVALTNNGGGSFARAADFSHAFDLCTSLQTLPLFNTAAGKNFSYMFYSCYALRAAPKLNTSAGVNFSNMFGYCYVLGSVPLLDTASGKDFSYMFTYCSTLTSVPLLNTASGVNFRNMFAGANAMRSVPLFNTSAGTNFSYMFSSCNVLQRIPALNTALGTDFSSMFSACYALSDVPLLNTANGTAFTSMFSVCYSLRSVPSIDTANGTAFSSMFSGCSSLQTIPSINTAKATTTASMFSDCTSLQEVPALNTSLSTAFNNMFLNCRSLPTIPQLDLSKGTTLSSMFGNCNSLQALPSLNVPLVTSFSSMLSNCRSLKSAVFTGARYSIDLSSQKLSEAALTASIGGIGAANGAQTLTITGNYGAVTPVSLSGTTTVGSTTVTMASTTGITTGMQVTGTGTPSTTGIAVTFTDAGDTVNLTAHGLSDGDEVAFSAITTTTGIVINTIYFVVGSTANTFQVAATAGGAALPLTTDGSGTLKYKATVTAINPNVSVTLSRPATSSGTNTLAFRTLKTNTALLKGWTVTG